jgi:hypothetical protein
MAAAGPNPPQGKSRPAAVNKPTPLPIDDTDPLALIYGALRGNADAVQENTAQIQALLQAVKASNDATAQQVTAILQAVRQQTKSVKQIDQAREEKITWGIAGIGFGLGLGILLVLLVFPLLHRLLG